MPHTARTARFQPDPFRALAFGAALLAIAPAGCKLIDQRTFNPAADRRPVPKYPPLPPAKVIPPLATVRFGAPPETWQPDLTAIVRQALARKPDALFTVQTVVPAAGSPQAQAASIEAAVKSGGQPVAQTIIAAGATAAQVDMIATTDAVATAEVRVTVR